MHQKRLAAGPAGGAYSATRPLAVCKGIRVGTRAEQGGKQEGRIEDKRRKGTREGEEGRKGEKGYKCQCMMPLTNCPNFTRIFARKINKMPEFYMVFAAKIFSRFLFGRGEANAFVSRLLRLRTW